MNTTINKNETTINDKYEYRLRNSWFNHQGILLDDFLITENTKDLSDIEVIAYIADTNKDIDGVITYEIKNNNLLHMNYYNSLR